LTDLKEDDMKTKQLLLAALLASLALHAWAEDDAPAQPPVLRRIVTSDGIAMQSAGPGSAIMIAPHGAGTMIVQGKMSAYPIKNAPYSAQMVTEHQQNLSDGNQITRQNATMSYRDSAGRTRHEIRDTAGGTRVVNIYDPVAGVSWILKPQDRTATKIPNGAAAGRLAGEAARARIEQMRKDGTLPTVERRKLDDGREEIIVKRVERADGEARQQVRQDVRIEVLNSLDKNGPALRDLQSRLAPLTAGAFADMKWASKATSRELGSRDFNGVKAEGKLRSYEIPAGEIGNRNAIVVSDETWYAPDLQVTVYSKHSDPRSGDTVFRLENLKREEPAASLFAVPSDYTVRDPLAGLK
jgi:hypothetical protein